MPPRDSARAHDLTLLPITRSGCATFRFLKGGVLVPTFLNLLRPVHVHRTGELLMLVLSLTSLMNL